MKPISDLTLIAVLLASHLAFGGGPKYVAGASYFDPSVKGVPVTWAGGFVAYYTDQGSLSAIMPHATADAYVADALSRWAAPQTVALVADPAGQLAEDVNGSNVTRDASGNITMPADIQPSAAGKPLGIVYDSDGAVTDALLGAGAGSAAMCFYNTTFGGPDAFNVNGTFAHALVVINGNCVQTSAQIPDFQYRLIRIFGRTLGLDWSQLNLNVLTGSPTPTSQDYAGFPVMHASDPISCVPISRCYANATQLSMDDEAAISRLYPVTPANIGGFPGKHVFADVTGRIHGSVWFTDSKGGALQAMQGLNVLARWVDPVSHQVSHQYAMSSVSGFQFPGNAGNTVTGFTDPTGAPWNRFGSDDRAVEGFFDLSGLEFPDASGTAQYQLTVENVDPMWSQAIGPYGPWQVTASGTLAPVLVTVTMGGDVQQDLLMQSSANQAQDIREPESFTAPAETPASGDWIGSLSGYGDGDYYWFAGRANRTLSVQVTALDESGGATQDKARPVIGMWALSSPPGTIPGVATPTAFNSGTFGMSALQGLWAAKLLITTNFRLGIADERGDGRPDYRYHARIFYGDRVIPARVSVSGGTILGIRGMGFRAGGAVTIGGTNAIVLSTAANQIVVSAPAMLDGVYDLALSDASGVSSTMTGALTYGAGASDLLVLLAGSNPPAIVGVEAQNPMRVRVVAADGVSPVAGASVSFSSSPAANLSACAGAASCTVASNESGDASTGITPSTGGVTTITATLAPASYSNPKTVQATVSAQAAALDVAVLTASRWVAQGADVDMVLTTRVVSYGSPLAGKTVNFQVMMGSASLTAANATSNASGYASTTVQLRHMSSQVQVSACIAPSNSPCAKYPLNVYSVAPSNIRLEMISGRAQLVPVGQAFQPVVVRVTDASSPPNAVWGASVLFWSIVCRPDNDVFEETDNQGMPVILASSQITNASDGNGLASIVPGSGGIPGPIEVEISATTGSSAALFFEVESAWMPPGVELALAMRRHKTPAYRALRERLENGRGRLTN